MPRDHARVNLAIWDDAEFVALPPAAQHLYLTLWLAPGLSYCGVHDWRPGRLAARSQGFSAEHIETVAACLVARHFLVIDTDTEEVLIRSWARFDGIMKQPRMAVSYANAFADVASQMLRRVLVHELEKIRKESPELACWADKRVAGLLDQPAVSAKDLPTPEDPFRGGFGGALGDGLPIGLPQTQGKVWGWVSTPPTPSPAPTTKPLVVEGGVGGNDIKPTRKRAGTRLPDDFEATDAHRQLAEELGINLDRELVKFRDYWLGEGKVKADWNATLRNWLRRTAEDTRHRPAAPVTRLPRFDELEEPPSGLSPAEYAAWDLAQREKRQGR